MATIERRVTSDGTITFRAKVRLQGHPSQTASFDRITDAKKWATQTEAAIREGRHFTTAASKKHTVGDLVDEYIANVIPTKGSQASHQEAQLNWWKDCVGDYALAAVTPKLLAEHRDKLLAGATTRGDRRSPATVNRYIAALSHAYTHAIRELEWTTDNPVRRLAKPSEPAGRVRYLDDDERARLFDACRSSRSTALYPIVLIAISTGMRQAELLNLHWRLPPCPPDTGAWSVVDMVAGRITIHQSKNGERRSVPLPEQAIDELRKIEPTPGSTLVFPRSDDPSSPVSFRTAFDNAVKAAGVENFRFHDLRHCTASYLAMNGATTSELASVLGHKTLQMVKRYSHLSDDHVAGVLERMTSKVLG
jgi:integrase